MQASVLLLHGLWMTPFVMTRLGNSLSAAGYEVITPKYATVQASPAQNADTLYQELQGLTQPHLHIIGHSLGGLVGLHLLSRYPDLPPGKLITLGTPAQGSCIARLFQDTPVLNAAFGQSLAQGLSGEAIPSDIQRDWGAIIGTLAIGLGAPFLVGKGEHDGAVLISEAEHPAQTERLYLPVSHSAMLFSPRVSQAILQFLHTGHFTSKLN
ncbi:MAG: alpha/beta fold hydrolase [Candidatus Thiocaldithrix dubininis]|uniref:Alpha/beta fold hydrolase n=1 Tax=Candidatus Thiocaldithrix dubininis TaxID=3080823 RepID=A0AA95HA82_9GAMM|nr:MAG: alpha/beta fold hydrolase [Candidatus Thiocaldithrix dubininis]